MNFERHSLMDAIIEYHYVVRDIGEDADTWRARVADVDGLVRDERADVEIVRVDAYYNRSLYPDPRLDPGGDHTVSTDVLILMRQLRAGWTPGDRMQHTVSLWVAMREDLFDWAALLLNCENRPNTASERSLIIGDVLVCSGMGVTCATIDSFDGDPAHASAHLRWHALPISEFEYAMTFVV